MKKTVRYSEDVFYKSDINFFNSLFTFILVLGIVVDDAIVVGENIYLWRERGLEPKEAAIKGAYQVSTPVIFAVLTTMVTFSPMLSVAGTTEFIKNEI